MTHAPLPKHGVQAEQETHTPPMQPLSGQMPAAAVMDQPCFYTGETVHIRATPKRHRLRQTLLCLYVDVHTLDAGGRLAGALVGLNKSAPISLHARDFGPINKAEKTSEISNSGKANRLSPTPNTAPTEHEGAAVQAQTHIPLFDRLNGILARTNTPPAARFHMLALPRVLGYSFRPLTLFYGFAADGALTHIIYEVNNTFSERHHYVADITALTPLSAGKLDASAASSLQATYAHAADKVFYVSPFQAVGGTYRFLSRVPDDTLKVKIFADDGTGGKLTASLTGTRRAVTVSAALKAICLRPFTALKVTAGIHWHALLLWRKGLKFYKHTSTQNSGVSKTYS